MEYSYQIGNEADGAGVRFRTQGCFFLLKRFERSLYPGMCECVIS